MTGYDRLVKAARYLTHRSWYFGAPVGIYELRIALDAVAMDAPRREAEAEVIRAAQQWHDAPYDENGVNTASWRLEQAVDTLREVTDET